MMYHKFKVVSKRETLTFREVHSTDAKELDDYLYQYLSDSFEWLDTHWNELTAENRGLNYYGVTFLAEEAAIKHFKKIITAWRTLFDLAPQDFTIHTEFDLDTTSFVQTQMERNRVINELDDLIALCDQAVAEQKILVHFGI